MSNSHSTVTLAEKLAFYSTVMIVLSLFCLSRLPASQPTVPPPDVPVFVKAMVPVEIAIEERRYSDALTRLEALATAHLDRPLPLLRAGQIYLVQHRWLMAEDAFNRALARDFDNPVALAGLAESLLQQGRVEPATTVWERAVAIAPSLATGLGRSHLSKLNFEAALAAFATQPDPNAVWYLAAMTAPTDVETARNHLYSLDVVDRPDLLAKRDYLLTALAPLTPTSPPAEVAKTVGIAFVQAELWPLAINALTIAHEADAHDAETLAFLAHARTQSGLPAFEMFADAVELAPTSPLVLSLQGQYLRQQGVFTVAALRFAQVIKHDFQNAAAYAEIAAIRVEQGRLNEAERWYQAAIDVADKKQPFKRMLAYFYLNYNYELVDKGMPLVETLAKANPTQAEYPLILGQMYVRVGQYDQAQALLQKAVELAPNHVEARYHLALILSIKGQTKDAALEYQHVVDWDTSTGLRERARVALQKLG